MKLKPVIYLIASFLISGCSSYLVPSTPSEATEKKLTQKFPPQTFVTTKEDWDNIVQSHNYTPLNSDKDKISNISTALLNTSAKMVNNGNEEEGIRMGFKGLVLAFMNYKKNPNAVDWENYRAINTLKQVYFDKGLTEDLFTTSVILASQSFAIELPYPYSYEKITDQKQTPVTKPEAKVESSRKSNPPPTSTGLRLQAMEAVRRRLRDYSNASFIMSSIQTTQVDDKYYVIGKFKSTNAFGAKITCTFAVEFMYTGSGYAATYVEIK